MVLFIVSAVLAVFALGFGLYLTIQFLRNRIPPIPFNKLIKRIFIVIGVFTLSFTTMMISIYLWGNIKPFAYELTAAIVGGLLVGFLGSVSLFSFIFHYWGGGEEKGISKSFDGWMFKVLMAAFPLFLISIFFLTDGFARYVEYPLSNGISFTNGFVSPADIAKPNIAFYAICILSGAIYVYFLCDHKFYLEYGKHGILESTFLVAFPAGIIGARLFYVIGNWNVEFAHDVWYKCFMIWEGGLTILGGAFMGIVVGVAWFMWRNKGYNIWLAVDIIVPTILIAQAVGRWGNFFNIEVYGKLSSVDNWWWLPRFIVNNYMYDNSGNLIGDNMMHVPLFFIECITNLLGYFVLDHVFGKALRKYTQLGDLAFGYIIWYGLTRLFMEPLRDTQFNMGSNGYWSWIWSLAFAIGGSLAIGVNHLVRYLMNKKDVNKLAHIIETAVIGVISLTLIIIGAVMMANSEFSKELVFNKFNWGLIVLALGVSVLFGLLITLPPLLIKKKEVVEVA